MSCLNSLENEVVFIPTAALIALVCLVWAQLGAPKDKGVLDKDMNLWFGILWTYAALFVVLIAVALFIHEPKSDCAKGFLVLSFLMTIANFLMVFGLNFIKIVSGESADKSLTGVSITDPCCRKLPWILFWVFLLFGLGLISFSVVGKLGGLSSCWFRLGVVLVGVTILFAVGMILKNFCCCIRLRWELWSHWCKNKKKKNWCKWEWWKRWLKAIVIAVVGLVVICFYIAGILKCCSFWIIFGVLFLVVVCCIFVKICKEKPKKGKGPGKKDKVCVFFYYSCGGQKGKGKGAGGKGKTGKKT